MRGPIAPLYKQETENTRWYKRQDIASLSIRIEDQSKIIMTLMKLKHNISYSILKVLFTRYSIASCRQIILNIIDILYDCLKEAIYFPNKDEISKNIPICFNNFKVGRVVLDCTEIFIQKPKNLCCQISIYSQYKHRYSIEYMTGVTPGGLICFISNTYGGRTSDNVIFEQSNIINYLEKNDNIMIDRRFTIDKLCKDNDIKLICPPFLREKTQLSKEEALFGTEIAKARVHIEQSNQRLKTFKILSYRMSSGLVKKDEQIFTIICDFVNLSSPILKHDKFNE
ncbi:uncharacterized protein LOC143342003 [Colletes latitarsis]|uniref:uncharacterized protein LOC143342003 n=1 Tax=Colletes latitarsis TaxID=2605962 RepID=UPI0040368FC8